MLQAGDPAPEFNLGSSGGGRVDSRTLRGRRYVLYFYPRDDTPGCTREACAFRDANADFEALAIPVFGVSADELKAHDRFVAKHALNFPLLSDPGRQLLEAYGVWLEKSLYGRKFLGIQRSSFVIGVDGRIEKAWPKVSPDTHAQEVLDYLAGRTPTKSGTATAARQRSKKPTRPG